MAALPQFLDSLVREIADLHENGVRVCFIGDRGQLGAELAGRMVAAEALTGSRRAAMPDAPANA